MQHGRILYYKGPANSLSAVLLARDEFRLVPLRIHDAEEPERLVVRIGELMDGVGGDIDGVEISDPVLFFADKYLSLASDADYHMLVPVSFEAAVAPGGYFEIPEVKLRTLPAVPYQDIPRDGRPVSVLFLLFFSIHPAPSEPDPEPEKPVPVCRGLFHRRGLPVAGGGVLQGARLFFR